MGNNHVPKGKDQVTRYRRVRRRIHGQEVWVSEAEPPGGGSPRSYPLEAVVSADQRHVLRAYPRHPRRSR